MLGPDAAPACLQTRQLGAEIHGSAWYYIRYHQPASGRRRVCFSKSGRTILSKLLMIAPDACGVKKPGLAMLPLFVRGSQSTRAVSARHPARRHRRRGALHSASAAPVPGVAGPPVVLHELSEHAFQVATTDYQKVIQALAPCWPHLSLGERISPLGPLQPWTALKRGCGAWTGVRWAARCVDGVLGVVQAQREVDCPASTAEAALPLRERASPWGVFIRPLRREAGWWRTGWLAAAGLIAPTSLSLPLTNRAGDAQPLDRELRCV